MPSEIAQVLYDTVLKTPYAPGERYKLLEAVDGALEEVRENLRELLFYLDARGAMSSGTKAEQQVVANGRALSARLLPKG